MRKRIRLQKLFNPTKKPQCVTPTSDAAKEKSENGWWPCQIARYNECVNSTAIYYFKFKKKPCSPQKHQLDEKKTTTVRSPWT